MKRSKLDSLVSVSRLRSIQVLMGLLFCYLLLMTLEIPLVWRTGSVMDSPEDYIFPIHGGGGGVPLNDGVPWRRTREIKKVSGLTFDEDAFDSVNKNDFSELHRTVRDAFGVGKRVLEETKLESANGGGNVIELENSGKFSNESCPSSVSLNGEAFLKQGKLMVVPCGLTLGSHITLVASPLAAHSEGDRREGSSTGAVSQFIMELQGLKVVDGEDPPRILHFNPRIKGDWSGKPVIEQNTCYRMQWGYPLRCEGWKSKAGDETVDGQEKCEKWIRDDDDHMEESKATWWLKRLIGRTKRVSVDWPYPFAEEKLFVLTLSAGLEGYHTYVDGRHISSFPYRPGFTLEDATGFYVNGDVHVHLVVAASLPTAHPSFAPQRHLEMVAKWQAPRLPDRAVELFIGILSAGNHFSERMAVRKSWMQHNSIKSSKYVARFFVAMHRRKEVNQQLMKEADFFGDIIIVPYLDHYDLVVLKTIAICEYGIRTAGAKYIMKCDDDTFVRVDAVMKEVKKIRVGRSLYVGNMNYYHRPLRHGKWAVKYEEWPKEEYPPYANGPGYILSADIANSIVLDFEKHKLKLFKMEDVSMGMWVEQFNASRPVEYRHSLKFCQFGCIDDYYTSHYQSPRQMICLWNKLQKKGKAQCCNMR